MSRPSSARLSAGGPLFNLDTFRDSDFQVDELISRLTEPVLNPGPRQRQATHVAGSRRDGGDGQVRQAAGAVRTVRTQLECRLAACSFTAQSAGAVVMAALEEALSAVQNHITVWLCRAEKDLARLQKNVDTRVEALQRELAERHAAFTVPPVTCAGFPLIHCRPRCEASCC